MRKNKMAALMQTKRIKYSSLKIKQPFLINHQFSQWQQLYYTKKQLLISIQQSNQTIDLLIKSYQQETSPSNLKQLQRLVNSNCQKITHCDQTISTRQESGGFMTGTMHTLNGNITRNFRALLFQEISRLFLAKANVAEITNRAQQHQRSFNAFNNTQNLSYNSLNSARMFMGEDRQPSLNDVNAKIQGLSMILKRMNVLVYEQGQLINQIDENMKKGTQNMIMGKTLLQKRAQRETGKGDSEFSFHGRINQAITALWVLNVFLIIVWVLKNLI